MTLQLLSHSFCCQQKNTIAPQCWQLSLSSLTKGYSLFSPTPPSPHTPLTYSLFFVARKSNKMGKLNFNLSLLSLRELCRPWQGENHPTASERELACFITPYIHIFIQKVYSRILIKKFMVGFLASLINFLQREVYLPLISAFYQNVHLLERVSC